MSDAPRAMRLFEDRGVLVVANEVLMIESDNKPGTLATIADRLAKAGENIEYAYLATSARSNNGLMILRPSNIKSARKVLQKK